MTEKAPRQQDRTVERLSSDPSAGGYWLGSDDALTTALPPEVQTTLGRFLGLSDVETLGEWVAAIREETGGEGIAIGDLCHADTETADYALMDGERYDFRCFYDAVILAAIEDQPVEIHTESPGGTAIEATAVGSDELSVSPPDAVFSFGISTNVEERGGDDPIVRAGNAAVCPYVRAFPDRELYHKWAADVSAATVAMPLEGATTVAAALAQTETASS